MTTPQARRPQRRQSSPRRWRGQEPIGWWEGSPGQRDFR